MEHINLEWFATINAGPNLEGWKLGMAIFAAKYLIYFIILGLLILWLRGVLRRDTMLFVLIGLVISLIINGLIGLAWYHPRPFEIGLGNNYLHHSLDSSFPSDHATCLLTLSFVILWREGFRKGLGFIVLFLSLIVIWARVFVGVHYPFDMIGSFFVAAISLGLAWLFRQNIERIGLLISEVVGQIYFKGKRQ